MRPSLTKSKSGSHLCLSLPSPSPCSLVSFSNNKLLPRLFWPRPWAVSCFLDAWWTPVTQLSPTFWLFWGFFLRFCEVAALLWRLLRLGGSELQSCLPARFRTRDTCGLLVWSLKRRDLPEWVVMMTPPSPTVWVLPLQCFRSKYYGGVFGRVRSTIWYVQSYKHRPLTGLFFFFFVLQVLKALFK